MILVYVFCCVENIFYDLSNRPMILSRTLYLKEDIIYCRVQFVSLSHGERKISASIINFIVSQREDVFSMNICFMVSRG